MNISEKIKNNKYLVLALVFAFLNMGAIFWFFGFQKYGDSSSYIELIHWFQGKGIAGDLDFSLLIIKPLGPLIALPFEFLGEGAGLIVQNILFYFFTAFLIFRIIELVFHNKEQALLGTILFTTALPMIYFGLSYMTDMGAWFFSSLSIYLTLLYLKHKDEKLIVINGLLSGIGALFKTNGGLGILFFLMIILLSKEFNLKEKFFKILKFGIPFSLPIMIFQIYLFAFLHTTTLNEYSSYRHAFFTQELPWLEAQPESVYYHLGGFTSIIYAYAGDFLKAFGIIGLFFALIGLWREWLQKNKERVKIYLALLPFSFSFLVYPPIDSRFAFISTPLLILLATSGLIYLKDILPGRKGVLAIAILIASHIVFNYYFLSVGSYRQIFLQFISRL